MPAELSARVPAEQRGAGCDDVRLLVSRGTSVAHRVFRDLPGQLRAGDVLVVNTSTTPAAAVNGRTGGERVVVHFSLVLDEPLGPSVGARLWWARVPRDVPGLTAGLVAALVSRGVQFAPLSLHTGVASAEAHEPPCPERFSVPPATAWLVNAARAGGGRVVAVGTTAVRALESAAGADGSVRAAEGWTDLVVTPQRSVRVVDGLLTGLHEPEASHLLMLEAIAGRDVLRRGCTQALRHLCLWHEFGDLHLLLPHEEANAPHYMSNVS